MTSARGRAPSTVSAIIPVFDGVDHVAGAAASVIAQTHPAVECIVVDDGSTDGSGAAAAAVDRSVRVLRTVNRGVAQARNHGLAASSGSLVAFLDADDRWDPERVAAGVALLEREAGVEAVLCSARMVDEAGTVLGILRADVPPTPDAMLMQRVSFPPSSSCVLIRRETLDRIGGLEPTLSASADWDLTLRLAERGPIGCIYEDLATYTIRSHSMSSDIALTVRDMRHAYRRAFARARRDRRFRRHARSAMMRALSGFHYDAGHPVGSLGYGALSLALDPRHAPDTVKRALGRLLGATGADSPPAVRRRGAGAA